MAKRSADTQLTKEGWGSGESSDTGGGMEDKPRKATVAQMANRRIARGRVGRRPGTQPRPSASLNTPTQGGQPNNHQQTGFSYNQGHPDMVSTQPFMNNNQPSVQSASFPPFGNSGTNTFAPQFTSSDTSFNFAAGQGASVNNPFITHRPGMPSGSVGGYQGSIFSMPAPGPDDGPKRKTPFNQRTLSPKQQRDLELSQNMNSPPPFAAHAPFEWPKGIQQGFVEHDPLKGDWVSTQSTETNAGHCNTADPPQQPSSNLFGQYTETPAQQQLNTNLFGQINTQQDPQQSNIFGQANSQQNPGQSQATSNLFGQTKPQMNSQQDPQRGQATSNVFGQDTTPSVLSQPTSALFGQAISQQAQPTSNFFGQNITQSQQPDTLITATEDNMLTSPDNSPQGNQGTNSGPFAFLNAPIQPGQTSPSPSQGKGGSTFDRISTPQDDQVTSGAQIVNQSTTPRWNSHEAKPKRFRMSDLPSPPKPTKEQLEAIKKRPIRTPTLGMPPTEYSQPAHGHVFNTLKFPGVSKPQAAQPEASQSPASQPQASQSLPVSPQHAPAPPFFGSFKQLESNGFRIKDSAISSETTAVAQVPNETAVTSSMKGRVYGMPPPAPAEFTEQQRRDLVTGYRLKALDVGLQMKLRNSPTFHKEAENVRWFYETQKQAILDADGLAMAAVAGGKRKAVDHEGEVGVQEKRSRIEAPPPHTARPQEQAVSIGHINGTAPSSFQVGQAGSSETSNGTASSSNPFGQNKSSGTMNGIMPSSIPLEQAASAKGKRKADEDDERDTTQGFTDSAKRARSKDPISYPSLPSAAVSANSQTSSIFKNILKSNDEAPSSDAAKASADGAQNELRPSQQFPRVNWKPRTSNLMKPANAELLTPTPPMPNKILHPSEPSSGDTFEPTASSASPTKPAFAAPVAPPQKPASESTTGQSMLPRFHGPFSPKVGPIDVSPPTSVKAPSFSLPEFNVGPVNFLSQFGKTAEESAKKEKAKRKMKDFDSDEDDEAEWERKDAEEQRAKKQKLEQALKGETARFVPGEGFVLTSNNGAEKGKSDNAPSAPVVSMFPNPPSSTKSGASVLSMPPSSANIGPLIFKKQSASHNIFGHLSDVESGADGSKTGDADDEDTDSENGSDYENRQANNGDTEKISPQGAEVSTSEELKPVASSNPFDRAPTQRSISPEKQSSGISLFDRISKDESGNPIRELPAAEEKKAESLFPKPSTGILAQTSPIFGGSSTDKGPSPTSSSNVFGPSPFATLIAQAESGSPPGGDRTWKFNSPIKFGSGSDSGFGNSIQPSFELTSPTPSKPSIGGLFGSPPNMTTETPTKPTSSLFSTTPANSAEAGFGFGFGCPPQPFMSSLAPPSGGLSNTTSRATSPGVSSANESYAGTEEDDVVEHHEQINLGVGVRGEEDEDVIFQVKAKAMAFDAKSKSWPSKGVGIMRILRHRETGKTRMLLRQENIGKIFLNAALLSTMKYEYVQNKTVKVAVAEESGKLATWIIRVGEDEDAISLSNILEANKSN